ncbi:hypothetical protein [Baekduia sp. Peel2402]|uniref:hypothetical protein n=1 Tax=Baekduia sp. Peel2402 TaxID=3458296 RepID=UPI00403EE4B7
MIDAGRDVEIRVQDRGDALVRVRVGDADGSGRPAMQLEVEHGFLPGGQAAVAFSDAEVGRVIDAMQQQRRVLRRLEGARR